MRTVLRRLLDVALLGALATVVIYATLLVVKVSKGYSRTESVPENMVRLEIVDGSGVDGLVERVVDEISGRTDMKLAIQVIKTVRFDLRPVPHTLVIARDENSQEAAGLLADRLGLDSDQVVYKPLEHNSHHATVTLVLGSEAEQQFPGDINTTEN